MLSRSSSPELEIHHMLVAHAEDKPQHLVLIRDCFFTISPPDVVRRRSAQREATGRAGDIVANMVFDMYEQTLEQFMTSDSTVRAGEKPADDLIRNIAMQLLMGLVELHSFGIAHRDVKPANVLIRTAPDGSIAVHLADFGAAKLLRAAARHTPFVTPPMYRAPELFLGSTTYNEKVDCWSAGCGKLARCPDSR